MDPDGAKVAQRAQLFCDKMNEICKYWMIPPLVRMDAVVDTSRKPPKPLLLPVTPSTVQTFAVGDPHGDMNHLLMLLLGSGIAEFAMPEDPLCYYDIVKRARVNWKDVDGDPTRYRLIPNLRLRPVPEGPCKEIIVLGDILDRGGFSDECLCLLAALAQEAASSGQKYPQVRLLFGDHEMTALSAEPNVTPNYKNTRCVCPPAIFDQEAVGSLLRYAISQGWMTYAYVAENGIVYSHSFFTRAFMAESARLLRCSDTQQSDVFKKVMSSRNPETIAAYMEFLSTYKCPPADTPDSNYDTAVREVINYFNCCLVNAAELIESVKDNASRLAEVQAAVETLLMFDLGTEEHRPPIMARFEEPVVPLRAQVVGHTRLEKHLPATAADLDQKAKEQYEESGDPFVSHIDPSAQHLLVDMQSSHGYNPDGFSYPRMVRIQPTGEVCVGMLWLEDGQPVPSAFRFSKEWDSTGLHPEDEWRWMRK